MHTHHPQKISRQQITLALSLTVTTALGMTSGMLSGCTHNKEMPLVRTIRPQGSLRPVTNARSWLQTYYAPRHPHFVTFEKDGKTGIMNKHGKVVIPAQYDSLMDVNIYGIFYAFKQRDWYAMDLHGRTLFKSFLFDNGPDPMCRGMVRYVKDGKMGFADVHGRIVIPAQWDYVLGFCYSAPFAVVQNGGTNTQEREHPTRIGGQWGMIDAKGRLAAPMVFTDQSIDQDGTVILWKGTRGHRVFVDAAGHVWLRHDPALSPLRSRS